MPGIPLTGIVIVVAWFGGATTLAADTHAVPDLQFEGGKATSSIGAQFAQEVRVVSEGKLDATIGTLRIDGPPNEQTEAGAFSDSLLCYIYATYRNRNEWSEDVGEDSGLRIFEVIPGSAPAIKMISLLKGEAPLVVFQNVEGAHTHCWRIYRYDQVKRRFFRMGAIGADGSRIEVGPPDEQGNATIKATNRNWENSAAKGGDVPTYVDTYVYQDGKYVSVRQADTHHADKR